MKIGVLALQGDFAEHIQSRQRLGVETAEVRLPGHLDDLAGLIIPGGESTTIGKLAVAFGTDGRAARLRARRPFGAPARALFSFPKMPGATNPCSA